MPHISQIKVPSVGPSDAEILLIGEAPGEVEELLLEPFIGPAGDILNHALSQNNIPRDRVRITNLCPYKLANNNFGYARDSEQLKEGIREIIEYIKSNKNLKVIVLLGNEPLFYLTGRKGIKKWRGTTINAANFPNVTILPTLHPASIIHSGGDYPLFSFDIAKIERIIKGELENYNFEKIIDPTGMDLLNYTDELLDQPEVTIDIETVKLTPHILCCGFGYGNKAICVVNHDYNTMSIEFERISRKILENKHVGKILHNSIFDAEIYYLNGIDTENISWDTMLAQHAIDPELQKSLAHCISIYTDLPFHKDMGKEAIPDNEKGWTKKVDKNKLYDYNCIDILGTTLVKKGQEPIVNGDENILRTFNHMMELIPVSRHLSHSGMLQDVERKNKIKDILSDIIVREQSVINTIAGGSLNVNSPKQVPDLLYTAFGLPVKYKKDKTNTKRITADEDAVVDLITYVKNNLDRAPNPLKKFEWEKKLVALKLILTLRGRRKLLSSYIDTELSVDNRYRSSYNIAGTGSGRFSASSYVDGTGNNAQTFPREVLEYEEADTNS